MNTRSLVDELKQSYLLYAMSVIASRALPDVRDGLKPSQRRIIVAMSDLQLSPDSEYRKCAKICGDTSGNYHPHGESIVYPTLVRLAQPFNTRYCLIDGQGNFGSLNGDPPAAMRYTEARLTSPAISLLSGLENDAVDLVPNFDNRNKEPTVLPGVFPNLLCNGGQGIAVGMTTNLLPHNLTEVLNGLLFLINNPNTTVNKLLKYITAPDFPTGGIIGKEELQGYYETGRGQLIVRGKINIELDRHIIITEMPYQIERTKIVQQVREKIKSGKFTDVINIQDESSLTNGTKIVLEMKRGRSARQFLPQLYKETSLQITIAANNTALVNGRPEVLSILQLMQHYVKHQFIITRRKAKHSLTIAEQRLHITEGLMIVLDNLNLAIKIITDAEDNVEAAQRLQKKLQLSKQQVKMILDLQLKRLTRLSKNAIIAEKEQLLEQIVADQAILADPKITLEVIKAELKQLNAKLGDKRRTTIQQL